MGITVNFDTRTLLKENQREVFLDESRFRIIAAGRRWGKSYLSVYILLKAAYETPNGLFWFVSPTQMQSRQIIWSALLEKSIPELVKKINIARLEVEFINGAKIMLKSAERPDSLRGVTLNGLVCDEVASMRDFDELWQKSLRATLSTTNGFGIFIGTTAGRNHFFDLYNQAKTTEGWKAWTFTTASGGYVSDEEIEAARADMDDMSFRQEYFASWESYQGIIVKDFDRQTHFENDFVLKDDEPISCCIDLNVNIMPCAVAVIREGKVIFFDEFFGSLDTPALIAAIKNRYPDRHISVYPDNSSGQRSSQGADRSSLKLFKENFNNVYTKSKNPRIMDRIHSFNMMVKNAKNEVRLTVTPNCKHLIESCEKHSYGEDGMPNKKSGYDHMFDAASYFINYKFGITKSVTKVSGFRL